MLKELFTSRTVKSKKRPQAKRGADMDIKSILFINKKYYDSK
jgi:hypothetical protein